MVVRNLNFDTPMTRQQVEQRRRLAQAMAAQASQPRRMSHPMQALAPFGQQLSAAIIGAQANRADRKRQGALRDALAGMGRPEQFSEEAWASFSQLSPDVVMPLAMQAQAARYQAQQQAQADAIARQQELEDAARTRREGLEDYRTKKGIDQEFAAPNLTGNQREYQQAVEQGFQGTIGDWIRSNRKAGATTIEMPGQPMIGRIPPGFQAIPQEGGGYTMEPVPGGPAAAEAEAVAQAEQNRQDLTQRTSDVVTQDIDRALAIVGGEGGGFIPETGFWGSIAQNVPGTDAFNVRSLVDTVKTNVGLDRLQAMRASSPSGAGLGSVTERENQMLQAALGNLEQSQGRQQFVDNMNRVYNIYSEIVHGPGNFERRELSFEGELPQGVSEEDVQFTMQKHGLTRDQVLERLR